MRIEIENDVVCMLARALSPQMEVIVLTPKTKKGLRFIVDGIGEDPAAKVASMRFRILGAWLDPATASCGFVSKT